MNRVKLFENSCLKGCLVYLVVLIMVVALGMTGLGGLSARFGVGPQNTKPGATALTPSGQHAANTQQPVPQAGNGSAASTTGQATSGPQDSKLKTQTSASPPQAGANTLPPISVQDKGISGQATAPFYIVQPGDTLWGLANRFGTTVETLRSINKLGDEFIKPRQLLYLPRTAGDGRWTIDDGR